MKLYQMKNKKITYSCKFHVFNIEAITLSFSSYKLKITVNNIWRRGEYSCLVKIYSHHTLLHIAYPDLFQGSYPVTFEAIKLLDLISKDFKNK